MRISLLLVFCFSCLQGFTQNYLTNAQVYDFQPGDVFQWREIDRPIYPMSSPFNTGYRKDSILTRTNYGADSIIYTYIEEYIFIPPFPSQWNPSYVVSDTFIRVVRELSDTAVHQNRSTVNPNCFWIKDSVETSTFHSYLVWNKSPEADSMCFEPSREYSEVYQRLGGPTYVYEEGSSQRYYERKWNYYHLVNGQTWGLLITAIEAEKGNRKISVYPNPAKDQLYISGIPDGKVMICDVAGRKVLDGRIHSGMISIQDLKPGTYVLVIEGSGESRIFNKIN